MRTNLVAQGQAQQVPLIKVPVPGTGVSDNLKFFFFHYTKP